ncbi:MAG: YggS family pyridoxal phosphate-dependent enzyme [Ignavibacteria bacterium]|nr:YggS family pyridoxal phosphate-dependent enzyme [Ignavibacteria bacterium]
MGIQENYISVKQNVRDICERTGRNPDEIQIIAVSKTFPITNIIELYSEGQTDFGENRIRELRDKYYNVSFQYHESVKINWHMVGHLQSRKVKDLIAFIHLIHSVDSFDLAKEIDTYSKKINKVTDILIQVNTSRESQKYGLDPSVVKEVCSQIKALPNIRIKGLMTIAKFTEDKNVIRESFKSLKTLFDEMKKLFSDMEHLSMGMTNDYEIAIEEGSTMLRIGSAIFGERKV